MNSPRARWLAQGLALGGLLGACSVDALDYRGKSCANGPCPGGLICVPQSLSCELADASRSIESVTGLDGASFVEKEDGGAAGPATSGPARDSLPAGDGNDGAVTGSASTEGTGAVGSAGTSRSGQGGDPPDAGPRGLDSGTTSAASDDGWGGTTERLFYVTNRWEGRYLKMCYRSLVAPADAPAALDFWQHTRNLVEATWGRLIDRQLQEWTECGGPSPPQFVVSLSATGPSSGGIGDPGTGGARQIALDIHATDAEILYFFGRALGFGHEYDRHEYSGACVRCSDDSACSLGERTTCLPSGYCGNPVDHESIMAAPDCGGVESIRKLSGWDALAAQRAYGSKPTGSLVEISGRCLDTAGGTGVPGERMQLWPCDEPVGETFYRTLPGAESASERLRARFDANDVCVEFSGPLSSSSATPLFTATCDAATPEQDFQLKSLRLRAMGNLCVAAARATAGAELAVYDCDAREATRELARWSLLPRSLELQGTGLCVSVPAGGVPGTHLALEPCDSTRASQRVSFDSSLILFDAPSEGVSAAPGCIRVANPYPVSGSPLVFWDACGPTRRDELFYATGPVNNGGQCMDRIGVSGEDNTLIGLAPCTGEARQEWDYHF